MPRDLVKNFSIEMFDFETLFLLLDLVLLAAVLTFFLVALKTKTDFGSNIGKTFFDPISSIALIDLRSFDARPDVKDSVSVVSFKFETFSNASS